MTLCFSHCQTSPTQMHKSRRSTCLPLGFAAVLRLLSFCPIPSLPAPISARVFVPIRARIRFHGYRLPFVTNNLIATVFAGISSLGGFFRDILQLWPCHDGPWRPLICVAGTRFRSSCKVRHVPGLVGQALDRFKEFEWGDLSEGRADLRALPPTLVEYVVFITVPTQSSKP